jgi:hypothetical protein
LTEIKSFEFAHSIYFVYLAVADMLTADAQILSFYYCFPYIAREVPIAKSEQNYKSIS